MVYKISKNILLKVPHNLRCRQGMVLHLMILTVDTTLGENVSFRYLRIIIQKVLTDKKLFFRLIKYVL